MEAHIGVSCSTNWYYWVSWDGVHVSIAHRAPPGGRRLITVKMEN